MYIRTFNVESGIIRLLYSYNLPFVIISLYSEANRLHIAGAARRELGAAKISVVCRAMGSFRRGGFEKNRKKYLRS